VYRARTDNLERLYVEIAHEIRSYYQLTFSATGIENPRIWRSVHLSTNQPGVTIFARTGYCPETPCQKADGRFIGGRPKTWNEVLAISRDPSVIFSVRQRLQDLKLQYTAETERIVRNLPTAPLLIEKVWNSDRKRSSERDRPTLLAHRVENGSRLVGIDAEVCGITADPETKSLPLPFVTSDPFPASSNEQVLTVLDPEIRIARRPGFAQEQTAYPDGSMPRAPRNSRASPFQALSRSRRRSAHASRLSFLALSSVLHNPIPQPISLATSAGYR